MCALELSLSDSRLRGLLAEALRTTGELCIVVCLTHAGGLRRWYLVQDANALDAVLDRIPASGSHGYSDRIEVYATGELPHRSTRDENLRRAALDALRETGEVVLACLREGDPELDVVEVSEAEEIEAWLGSEREGVRMVGPHPFRHDADPDATVYVAYNAGADGTIRPGAY